MFKLSLRELFLLVVLAAVGLGWWLDRGRLAKRLNFALVALSECGGSAGYHNGYFYAFIGHSDNVVFDPVPPEERIPEFRKTLALATAPIPILKMEERRVVPASDSVPPAPRDDLRAEGVDSRAKNRRKYQRLTTPPNMWGDAPLPGSIIVGRGDDTHLPASPVSGQTP